MVSKQRLTRGVRLTAGIGGAKQHLRTECFWDRLTQATRLIRQCAGQLANWALNHSKAAKPAKPAKAPAKLPARTVKPRASWANLLAKREANHG
jgi:hypothetical protein